VTTPGSPPTLAPTPPEWSYGVQAELGSTHTANVMTVEVRVTTQLDLDGVEALLIHVLDELVGRLGRLPCGVIEPR
jgi:hypothetical protein